MHGGHHHHHHHGFVELRKRIHVHRNGVLDEPKVLYLEEDWSLFDLLKAASERLAMPQPARRVFNADGVEIDDCMMIEDDDLLFLSMGPAFKTPRAQTQRALSIDTAAAAAALVVSPPGGNAPQGDGTTFGNVPAANGGTSGDGGGFGGSTSPPPARDGAGAGADSSPVMVSLIGGYTVGELLGKGGFGAVRRGVHQVTGEEVALKFLKKSEILSMGAAERTTTEIRCLTTLHHPNIITMLQYVESPTHFVLVLELMKGRDLGAYLRQRERRSLPEPEASPVFHQILSGVGYAHNHHICHRDLKLENILLKDEDHTSSGLHVKIADFGLSEFFRPGGTLRSNCGSLQYLAPELFRGSNNAGPPLDVWSLGVILFAILCGRLPFEDNANRIVKCQYKMDDRLSPEAKDLIRRMLRSDPAERATIPEVFNHCWLRAGGTPSAVPAPIPVGVGSQRMSPLSLVAQAHSLAAGPNADGADGARAAIVAAGRVDDQQVRPNSPGRQGEDAPTYGHKEEQPYRGRASSLPVLQSMQRADDPSVGPSRPAYHRAASVDVVGDPGTRSIMGADAKPIRRVASVDNSGMGSPTAPGDQQGSSGSIPKTVVTTRANAHRAGAYDQHGTASPERGGSGNGGGDGARVAWLQTSPPHHDDARTDDAEDAESSTTGMNGYPQYRRAPSDSGSPSNDPIDGVSVPSEVLGSHVVERGSNSTATKPVVGGAGGGGGSNGRSHVRHNSYALATARGGLSGVDVIGLTRAASNGSPARRPRSAAMPSSSQMADEGSRAENSATSTTHKRASTATHVLEIRDTLEMDRTQQEAARGDAIDAHSSASSSSSSTATSLPSGRALAHDSNGFPSPTLMASTPPADATPPPTFILRSLRGGTQSTGHAQNRSTTDSLLDSPAPDEQQTEFSSSTPGSPRFSYAGQQSSRRSPRRWSEGGSALNSGGTSSGTRSRTLSQGNTDTNLNSSSNTGSAATSALAAGSSPAPLSGGVSNSATTERRPSAASVVARDLMLQQQHRTGATHATQEESPTLRDGRGRDRRRALSTHAQSRVSPQSGKIPLAAPSPLAVSSAAVASSPNSLRRKRVDIGRGSVS